MRTTRFVSHFVIALSVGAGACANETEPVRACEGRELYLSGSPEVLLVGDSVELGVSIMPEECAPLEYPKTVHFDATEAGTFVVPVELEDLKAEAVIVVAAPLSDEESAKIVETHAMCSDLDVARGFLLCVGAGVSVLEPGSGRVISRTEEIVPALYGISADADRFATAAFGCLTAPECQRLDDDLRPCCPEGQESQPGGVRLYDVAEDGQLSLRSFFGSGPTDEVALAGDRAFVFDGRLHAFDVGQDARPAAAALGCTEANAALGLPIAGASRVYLLGVSQIFAYDRAALETSSCHEELAPAASVDLRIPYYKAAFEKDGALLVKLVDELSVFNEALEEIDSLYLPGLSRTALSNERIYASTGDLLLVIDVTNARAPKLLGAKKIPNIQGIAADADRVYVVD